MHPNQPTTAPSITYQNQLQNLKLAQHEVGWGEDANHLLSRRLWTTYFAPNPRLFEQVFGYPISEVPAGETITTIRLWRNEFIAVM